jgi:hypothetical protein
MIPINRAELQELIQTPSELKNMRYPTDELLYKMHRDNVPRQDQMLLLATQISTAKAMHGITTSSLIHNSFEYRQLLSRLPKTRHFLLFFTDPIDPKVEMAKWLKAMNIQATFDHFINDKENQSVPEFNHHHIFIHF